MLHYLNDLALWHRQGEEYQRRVKSKPPRPSNDSRGAGNARSARGR
jgi:hypothetical protein